MAWYDIFSIFYDFTVELVYRPYRPIIAEELDLTPGDNVLDLACGTGRNHPQIMRALNGEGRIFGVDFSEGMLRRARRQAKKKGWDNVHLLQKDARKLTNADLAKAVGEPVELDKVVVTLGLSVIPDWESVLSNTFELLRPGGKYVIFDIHCEPDKRVLQSWLVTKVAQADLGRQTWKELDARSEDFSFRYLPGSPHVHGGRPFLASGARSG